MQNYTTFAKNFIDFSIAKKLGATESHGNSPEKFIDNIAFSLRDCKIFNVTDKVKNLLCLTKTPLRNDEVHLPFPIMFLDVSFTQEELKQIDIDINYKEVVGIIVQQGKLLFSDEKQKFLTKINGDIEKDDDGLYVAGIGLRISILSFNHGVEGKEIWFDTFNKSINIKEEFKGWNMTVKEFKDTDPKTREFIHKFVINFLNFINDPEVEYRECIANPKQNEKRIKRGKMPIPNNCPITVSGKLKIYLDSLNERDFTYNYRFWVRGHFRTLRAERWGKNRGKRLWVAPFLKGKGVLVEKIYHVENKNI